MMDAPQLKPTVLVVDDEPDIRDSLRELLELVGYHAETADNGETALRHLEAHGPPALLLLDLMMPVMDGVQLLQRLRGHPDPALAALPVVVCSAMVNASSLRERFGCEVMAKPVDVSRLLDLVQRHAGTHAA